MQLRCKPDSWAVDVDEDAETGEVKAEVTPPDTLPEDVPKLHVEPAWAACT